MFWVKQFGLSDYSAQSAGWGDLEHCLSVIDSMTSESEWALGAQFTTADVVFGGTLDFAIKFGWLDSPTEKVAAYVNRLKAREAYRASHDESWHDPV